MQPHTFLHTKTVQYIYNACGNVIVVAKQEILVISLTDFLDAVSRRYNDVILMPAIHRMSGNDFVPSGQCTGTMRRVRATVELLRQETLNFLAPNLCPPSSLDLSPVEYEIWAVMQHRVYHRQIHSVDDLKRRLIDI